MLKTLTPDKRDTKYNDGGAVTAAAGIAAMLALTTPLAIEGQQTFKELEIERKKVVNEMLSVFLCESVVAELYFVYAVNCGLYQEQQLQNVSLISKTSY